MTEDIHTLVVGGGQAGIAASEHLGRRGLPHLVLERARIAERWRSERWDSLVANGPAWHDRFPNMTFDDIDPFAFAPKERIATYFEDYARQIAAPVRCGVNVTSVVKTPDGFLAETSQGSVTCRNLIAATGPFQRPLIPENVPDDLGIVQMHSTGYRNPDQLPAGAVLVVGSGASGSQIADELLRAGRRVYLSVGPHNRPPIRYRGKDFVWWLGVLGEWDARTTKPGMEHVTIAVSGAYGGRTVDFRDFAARGMTLIGRAGAVTDGVMSIAPDLAANIAGGDANYLATLDAADAYAAEQGLDLPEEPEARRRLPDPDCVTNPLRQLDLKQAGISAIIWATGFAPDYSWLRAGRFDAKGAPVHDKGITEVPGLYFLGLPWLTRRASPFIWGVWHDADHIAGHIAARG
ncbi:flavin-containing monooxygenase [Paragemmobacter straminiformis]|uniref:NAD(P)-binding domain-containing protein n=1 Tax=Paragemmobacter straminiformis TaxID=2045119 RepID=A0A842IBN1_9RHOB|nr:NAD(P)/FAD-dependent oxidoreductase [Gemmobacter straminiformis]MBC2837442.1 NAD(P)-binding domain-containing protein [Gemmobacter straminiformis]